MICEIYKIEFTFFLNTQMISCLCIANGVVTRRYIDVVPDDRRDSIIQYISEGKLLKKAQGHYVFMYYYDCANYRKNTRIINTSSINKIRRWTESALRVYPEDDPDYWWVVKYDDNEFTKLVNIDITDPIVRIFAPHLHGELKIEYDIWTVSS